MGASQEMLRRLDSMSSKVDYDEFLSMVSEHDGNALDAFVDFDKGFEGLGSELAEEKTKIEAGILSVKQWRESLRGLLLQFMEKQGLHQIKGTLAKSVTVQPAKDSIKVVGVRQIMKGSKYVDLSALNKEDLVSMLVAKGVKTREVSRKETVAKPAGIRVIK